MSINGLEGVKISDTYLYTKGDYGRNIVKFLINSTEVNKTSEDFNDIIYEVKKRQTSASILNTLMNDKVVLLIAPSGGALPRAFKVFTATDIRYGDRKDKKVYIDVTEIMSYNVNGYVCNNISILITYLMSAMNHIIYYNEPRRILNNSSIVISATEAFVDMFNYVLGYLKVSNYGLWKDRLTYLVAMYCQVNLLSKNGSDSARAMAKKISKLSQRDCDIMEMLYTEDDFATIDTFINKIKSTIKAEHLTTEVFVDKWMYLFGSGTYFGCELYVAFATMLIDCYNGVFINNSKSIEKVAGNNMIEFVNALLKVGSDYR